MIKYPHPVPYFYDWISIVIMAVYVLANLVTIGMAGMALVWYAQSSRPVVDWIDPEGPGFRVVAVTPEAVTVRWINLRLALPCPGRTEVAILGHQQASHIEAYPFVIDEMRQTFERRYALLPAMLPGVYQLRITDIAYCNPLFENRQILRVPFEFPGAPHE